MTGDEEDPLQRRLEEGRAQGFFDKSLGIRIAIGAIIAVALLLFLHFREVRLDILEMNAPADRTLISQVDFEFADDEAMLLSKQEAMRDVGPIYQIEEGEIAARQASFERSLSSDESWREEIQENTFEEIYEGVDQLTRILSNVRFADGRTLRKMEQSGVSTTNIFSFAPKRGGEAVLLPSEVWDVLEERAFQGGDLEPETAAFIVDHFEGEAWTLQVDRGGVQAIRNAVGKGVPQARSKVYEGARIVEKGEVVSARHVGMVQEMNRALRQQRNLWHPMTFLGSLILTLLFLSIVTFYLKMYHPSTYGSNKKLFLLTSIIILTLVLAKTVEYLLLRTNTNVVDGVRFPLLVPFAAIMICSLLNARIATFITAFLTILFALALAVEPAEFLIINLFASLVAVMSTRSLRQRKEVFVVCIKAWACCFFVVIAFHAYHGTLFTFSLIGDFGSTFVFMLMTAVLVVGLLPLLESIFRMITDITLTEYMDPTHSLLRRLSIEAPGTYQHSIVVGNLAEVAAVAIGANGLFCRVAALYHDIGKLLSPQYFVENQQSGWNIHQLLTPKESAQVIMAHVPEGVAIARKHGMPEPFIDIIKEHHGTTLVYYFYHAQVELEGGAEKVNLKEFRYSGPKPFSKESAIIMIADTVEAASRSIEEPTEAAVDELVGRLIREKAEDGQFDRCRLTFEELGTVRRELVKALVAAGHTRMAYPLRTTSPPAGSADDPAV